MRVGECRVIVCSIRAHAKAHGAAKIFVAPAANPGIAIRRQVGGIDAAERRLDALASRKRLGGIGGMAASAVARLRQRLALRDHLRRRGSWQLGARLPRLECSAQSKADQNRPRAALPLSSRWRAHAKQYSAKFA